MTKRGHCHCNLSPTNYFDSENLQTPTGCYFIYIHCRRAIICVEGWQLQMTQLSRGDSLNTKSMHKIILKHRQTAQISLCHLLWHQNTISTCIHNMKAKTLIE